MIAWLQVVIYALLTVAGFSLLDEWRIRREERRIQQAALEADERERRALARQDELVIRSLMREAGITGGEVEE